MPVSDLATPAYTSASAVLINSSTDGTTRSASTLCVVERNDKGECTEALLKIGFPLLVVLTLLNLLIVIVGVILCLRKRYVSFLVIKHFIV